MRARWPRIWDLPRIPRSTRHAAAAIAPGAVVLDVGASRGGFRDKLPRDAIYRTLDVDPEVLVDHRSLDEVDGASIDAVVSFETIEHLTLDEAVAVLAGIRRVLTPGGRAFLSTPNVHHPWAYLRSATHRTPFCYDELGGLMLAAGLEVEAMFRCHHDAFLKTMLRAMVLPIYRIADVDFAKSILAVGSRPS
jgi:SAM-dependent methyltransferase